MEINKTAIVGAGALGIMYADRIKKFIDGAAGAAGMLGAGSISAGTGDSVSFVMDHARYERHRDDVYTVNGVRVDFDIRSCEDYGAADLVIVAVKATGLRSSMSDVIAKITDDHTVIISVLNGISSEEILGEMFDKSRIVPCVAAGMDAMRDGTDLKFTQMGKLLIGLADAGQKEALEELVRYFERIDMPYSLEEDIMHSMWAKFMLNVGCNQTCMVYGCTYGQLFTEPEINKSFMEAMQEVVAVSEKEGIGLGLSDIDHYINIIKSLDPDGYPSMRQDAEAHRISESDMFAGTVIRLAEKHGLDVPRNRWLLEQILEMESKY